MKHFERNQNSLSLIEFFLCPIFIKLGFFHFSFYFLKKKFTPNLEKKKFLPISFDLGQKMRYQTSQSLCWFKRKRFCKQPNLANFDVNKPISERVGICDHQPFEYFLSKF